MVNRQTGTLTQCPGAKKPIFDEINGDNYFESKTDNFNGFN